MEAYAGEENAGTLRAYCHRLIRYAEKVFDLSSEVLDKVSDTRQQPRTLTSQILKSALAMCWARLALEALSPARFWKRWLEGDMVSADTMGRVHAAMDVGQLRILQTGGSL